LLLLISHLVLVILLVNLLLMHTIDSTWILIRVKNEFVFSLKHLLHSLLLLINRVTRLGLLLLNSSRLFCLLYLLYSLFYICFMVWGFLIIIFNCLVLFLYFRWALGFFRVAVRIGQLGTIHLKLLILAVWTGCILFCLNNLTFIFCFNNILIIYIILIIFIEMPLD